MSERTNNMTNEEMIARLRELIEDRKSFITGGENDEIYIRDKQALEAAIKALEEHTAHWDISCDGYYPFCSVCRKEPPGREMSAYCPHCGRRMVTPERRKK